MIDRRATYRLQLHAGFTFADAEAAVPYLAELGISHLYLSPILAAAEGSTHGYDVIDPERISDVLGGAQGLEKLAAAAHAAGLGILVDIVPNHMSIATGRSKSAPLHMGATGRLEAAGRPRGGVPGNRWWFDVLENGPSSYYAHFFDVDWTVGDDRVLLPVLGDRYGRAIGNGVIRIVEIAKGRLAVRAHDLELPLAPRSLGTVVKRAAERCKHVELAFIGDALSELPSLHRRDSAARRRRHRDKDVLVRRLAALCEELAVSVALADEVAAINADPIELDAILEEQAYRLVHWTVSANQLSYRRFFDIDTLVGLRNEDDDVFEACHALVLGLVAAGTIDGLRIDHVDGLRDPERYLRRLRERAPDAWIVVEKILTGGETLPESWPTDGTTGYEFAERIGGLFVDPAHEREMTEAFERFTGESWEPMLASRRARLEVMSDTLHSELMRLTELAVRACSSSPACRDYTRAEIETTIAEIFAGYPTYRTYFSADRRGEPAASDADSLRTQEIARARLAAAVAAAHDARPDLDRDLLAYLEGALAFEIPGDAALELACSAQQVTGAITAKGDEDTLLYRQVRLLARCDVGAELREWAHSPSSIHHALGSARPHGLLATSTHDTKRSEDVRARIAVLSELPHDWAAAAQRWRDRAERFWNVSPDRVIEYTLLQTLVGAWPLPVERAKTFARKASREARLRTSWRRPDETYDRALDAWLDGLYSDDELVADIAKFAESIRPHGDRNSLAQLLLKMTAPGVPDFYQGTELYDDSLVDPDNRRPVDLARRRDKLRALADASVRDVVGDLSAMKLWTIRRVLGLRRKHPARFAGAYRAQAAVGPHAERVFAFARGDELVTIVPRLGVHADGFRDTVIELPPGPWIDVLSDQQISGGTCAVAQLWRTLPIALLARP